MNKQIAVTIDPMGNVPKIEAIGFNGVGCEAATKGLENKLGAGVASRSMKSEFYNSEGQTEQNTQTW